MDANEEALKRKRVTVYLLVAGGAVLLIPLLILLYIRSADKSSSNPNYFSHPFAPRENVADRIKAAQTPAAAVLPANGSAAAAGASQSQAASTAAVSDSLGFIKGGSDFAPAEKAPPQPAKAEAPPSPAPKPTVAKNAAPPDKTANAKPGPKPFLQPHLQKSAFGINGQRGQIGQMGQPMTTGQISGGASMPDMSKMMQGMTSGAGGTGGAAMPDMSKMMQSLMPAGAQPGNAPSAAAQPKQ
jgi:hypothetical protein